MYLTFNICYTAILSISQIVTLLKQVIYRVFFILLPMKKNANKTNEIKEIKDLQYFSFVFFPPLNNYPFSPPFFNSPFFPALFFFFSILYSFRYFLNYNPTVSLFYSLFSFICFWFNFFQNPRKMKRWSHFLQIVFNSRRVGREVTRQK